MNNAIGIDLGTTYSCIGIWNKGHVDIITDELGKRTTPSYVFIKDNEILVGDPAKYKSERYPQNSLFDVKRIIGREFSNIQSDLKHWPFKVVEKSGKPYIRVEYKNEIKDFMPEEISAMILSKLKNNAQDYIGCPVKDAVITVPAYFNDAQRRATRDAGKIAGLNVLQIINEPTAAALAYGLNKTIKGEENILIFDLGGGTFDISILNINNNTFTVKATAGNAHLGGEDFTNRLVDYFVKEFKNKYDRDLSTNSRSLNRLRIVCERAKCNLSFSDYASIEIECLFDGIDFFTGITRVQFEELISDLLEEAITLIEKAIEEAHLTKSDINEVILVGGSSRIPMVEEMVSSYFHERKIRRNINPDEAVACGAAIHAASLSGDQSESIKKLKFKDVTPLSLGIEIKGGLMNIVIKNNTLIPIRKTHTYITAEDNQTTVDVRVLQGERSLAKDNFLLDRFILEGITPAPCGEVKIDVTFDIDSNGILNVSAVEKGTTTFKAITISNDKGRLYQDEVERLIKEAKMYEEEDRKAKERIESLNSLEKCAYNIRKRLNNKKDKYKISKDDEEKLAREINNTIEWVKNNYDASKEECINRENKLRRFASLIFNI
ncbi:hsp71-like protein [Piromyces finnis]|uniref:Hsp71-like protein n=1 Tax=Piromyces finnis TaxID=1754191 RepID=A0A1Y1UW18_9FUNG|nr:hsp71-like protein [Piromyces finnis]|eukprot:ORX41672.1 hsp71-like protein [Piromyces finnis]